jgi:hypothetical protein
MWQQGQVFKLKARGVDGQPLWAYRYRLEGRSSARPQVGGFASRADALKALEKVLARLGPGGRAVTMTLGELVEEYLEMHQAEPVTIAKLRWLLGKATATLGGISLSELSPKDVYAWRLTIPEGHRFEATQAGGTPTAACRQARRAEQEAPRTDVMGPPRTGTLTPRPSRAGRLQGSRRRLSRPSASRRSATFEQLRSWGASLHPRRGHRRSNRRTWTKRSRAHRRS